MDATASRHVNGKLYYEHRGEARGLQARQYVYGIGSYHYNRHSALEGLIVITDGMEVCADGRVERCEPGDVIVINSNDGHATLATQPHTTVLLLQINADYCPTSRRTAPSPISVARSAESARDHPGFACLRTLPARILLASGRPSPEGETAWESELLSVVTTLFDHFRTLSGAGRRPAHHHQESPGPAPRGGLRRPELPQAHHTQPARPTLGLQPGPPLPALPSARGHDLLRVSHSRAAAPGHVRGGLGLPPELHLAHGHRGHMDPAPLSESALRSRRNHEGALRDRFAPGPPASMDKAVELSHALSARLRGTRRPTPVTSTAFRHHLRPTETTSRSGDQVSDRHRRDRNK